MSMSSIDNASRNGLPDAVSYGTLAVFGSVPFTRALTRRESEGTSQHYKRFGSLREVYRVREFQLVLRVDGWERKVEDVVRILKGAVTAEKARARFNDIIFPGPLGTFFVTVCSR